MPPKKFSDGEKVLCYHGPMMYEAKVSGNVVQLSKYLYTFFRHVLLYISYYSPGFLVIAQVYTLINCAEKRFCSPKAVSLFCRPVVFVAILSFLTPRRIFKY